MLLTRMFGHSATDIQVFIGVAGIFFTSITDLYLRIGKLEATLHFELKKIGEEIVEVKSLIKEKL